MMRNTKAMHLTIRICVAIIAVASTASCGDQNVLKLAIAIENRSLSKVPYFIAQDQGLFKKHGLNVELSNPPPDFEGGRRTLAEIDWWTRLMRRVGLEEREFDLYTRGGTPAMLRAIDPAPEPHRIAIAATARL